MPTVKEFQKQAQNKEKAYQHFISLGYSPEASAGIVGNLLYESNLNTTAEGDKGYKGGSSFGIAQFRGERLNRLKSMYGKDWNNFDNQLQFVEWELNNTHKKAGNLLRNTTDVHYAGQVFSDYYEIPAKKYNQNPDRRNKVEQVYQTLVVTPQNKNVIPVLTELPTPEKSFNFTSSEVKKIDIGVPPEKEAEQVLVEKQAEKEVGKYKPVEMEMQQQEFIQPRVQLQQEPEILERYAQVSQFLENPLMQRGGTFVNKSYQDSLYLYEENLRLQEEIRANPSLYINALNRIDNKNAGKVIDITDYDSNTIKGIRPISKTIFTSRVPNPIEGRPEIVSKVSVGNFKKPTSPYIAKTIEENLNLPQRAPEKNITNLNSIGIRSQEQIPVGGEATLKNQVRVPTSYDIQYSANRMNQGRGYYDQNNQQNVDLETALRAQAQAERANLYWAQKYGNSQNPNAIERLNTLQDEVIITPNYQEGGITNNRFIKKMQKGGQIPVSSQGVYTHPGQAVLVPTDGSITMKNINYPILGISQETGQRIMMMPGQEYFYPQTQNVLEIPQLQNYFNR